jgi:hypothetical protein
VARPEWLAVGLIAVFKATGIRRSELAGRLAASGMGSSVRLRPGYQR